MVHGAQAFHRAVDLHMVVIHERDEVRELVVSGKQCHLPDLSFLDLAVTEDEVDVIVFAVDLERLGNARRRRRALTE